MLLRLAMGLLLAVVLLVFDGPASVAATELPPTPADIGLPRAPTVIGLPVASLFRAGVPIRRPDGRLGFAPAPRPAPRPSASDIIVTKLLAPPSDLSSIPASRRDLESLVRRLAPEYGLDPNLVIAVIATESSFRVGAVSSRGATGLMQLVPETARRFGVENSHDPEQNLRGGMSYLRWLLSYFRGNIKLALAAYNAGERAVERYSGVPPYAETKGYVGKVMRIYPKVSHPFDSGLTRASPVIAPDTAHDTTRG